MKNKTATYCLILFLVSIYTAKAQDTIPFRLGHDNRIYMKVIVNNSEPLDFIFDTGANGMVVNTTQTDVKLALDFDSETENIGANGMSIQKLSNSNTLKIGEILKSNQQLVGIAYPKKHYSFDGVIGYPFFEDYVIEIDYDTQKMILHNSLQTIATLKTYTRLKMEMIGEVPFVDFTIIKNDKPITFPAMIDTGFNGSLIVYYKIVSKMGLADHFQKIKSTKSKGTDGTSMNSDLVLVPKARIGKIQLDTVYANLNKTPSSVSFPAIMGGSLLKQLHWVIDFKGNAVYIR